MSHRDGSWQPREAGLLSCLGFAASNTTEGADALSQSPVEAGAVRDSCGLGAGGGVLRALWQDGGAHPCAGASPQLVTALRPFMATVPAARQLLQLSLAGHIPAAPWCPGAAPVGTPRARWHSCSLLATCSPFSARAFDFSFLHAVFCAVFPPAACACVHWVSFSGLFLCLLRPLRIALCLSSSLCDCRLTLPLSLLPVELLE